MFFSILNAFKIIRFQEIVLFKIMDICGEKLSTASSFRVVQAYIVYFKNNGSYVPESNILV